MDETGTAILQTFIDATKRFRWVIITTILLSSLSIMHIYMEKVSYTEPEFQNLISGSIANNSKARLNSIEHMLTGLVKMDKLKSQISHVYEAIHQSKYKHLNSRNIKMNSQNLRLLNKQMFFLRQELLRLQYDDVFYQIKNNKSDNIFRLNADTKIDSTKFKGALEGYAALKYDALSVENTLKEVKTPSRIVPLLQLDVPGDDFLPIVGLVIAGFSVGLWIVARGIFLPLDMLSKMGNSRMIELAHLNFAFASIKKEYKQDHIAQGVEYIIIWLSFIFFFSAGLIDILPAMLQNSAPIPFTYGPENAINIRFFILVTEFIVLFFSSIFTTTLMIRIHKIFDKENGKRLDTNC